MNCVVCGFEYEEENYNGHDCRKTPAVVPELCTQPAKVEAEKELWVVRHVVTEVEWAVEAHTAAGAIKVRLREAELAAGKILDLPVVAQYVKDLTVRRHDEPLGAALMAGDLLADEFLASL